MREILIVTLFSMCFYAQAKTLEQALIELSSEINKSLPVMVDSDTRLDSTTGFDNQVIYHYTLIKVNADDVNKEEFSRQSTPKIKNYVCTMPIMQAFRKYKIPVTYQYRDEFGKQIATIKIETKHC